MAIDGFVMPMYVCFREAAYVDVVVVHVGGDFFDLVGGSGVYAIRIHE